MKSETLERIGRSHCPEDIISAFHLAKAEGFDNINADIIAGLPGETTEDFTDTLRKVIELNPESITVHIERINETMRHISLCWGKDAPESVVKEIIKYVACH